jgi:hypothetical protein
MDMPRLAIYHFISWNITILVGRIRIRQYQLAKDQLIFFARELVHLSLIHNPVTVLLLVAKAIAYRTAGFFRRLLAS